VKQWCAECLSCALAKDPARKNVAPLVPIKSNYPFEIITSDIVGPFNVTSNGNKYILVICDHFSKWVQAYAISNMEAVTVAKCFYNYFMTFGLPSNFLTDQGTNYMSALIREQLALLDIKQLRTTPYHPQCDGLSERFNRTLLSMLRCYSEQNDNWDELLTSLCFAYNTSVHSSTGVQPFVVVYGRFPKLPIDLMFPEAKTHNVVLEPEDYVENLIKQLNQAYEVVRKTGELRVEKQRFYHDRSIRGIKYKIGDRVMLHQGEKKKQKSNKLMERWRGPYTVVGIKEQNDESNNKTATYVLQPDNNGKIKEAHFNRLKLTGARVTRASEYLNDTIEDEIVVPTRRGRGRPRRIVQPSEIAQQNDVVQPSELILSNEIPSESLNPNEQIQPVDQPNVDSLSSDNQENVLVGPKIFVNENDKSEDFEPNYYYKRILTNNDLNKRVLPDRRAKRDKNYHF
jgi:hypothetical protein